jgi:hypothetical protein
MPPFQSPQTMIREDFVRIVLAGLSPTFSTRRKNTLFFGINRPPRRLNKGTGAPKCL